MFDPFGDYWQEGYLRNHQKEKDINIIKHLEHDFFEINMPKALEYLNHIVGEYVYDDFLKVHEILFSDIYPWAGKDRATTTPDKVISKGYIHFSRAKDVGLAINSALKLAQEPNGISEKPGEVMGLFAYGHPFLDGNGRTMILVHSALCKRAGFSITWGNLNKSDYLDVLSDEIESPGQGVLDSYLLQYKKDDSVF